MSASKPMTAGEDEMPPVVRPRMLLDPELPTGSSWQAMAGAYATMAMAYNVMVEKWAPSVDDAVARMTGEMITLRRACDDTQRLSLKTQELVVEMENRRAEMMERFREYNPELTPHGGVKFSPNEFSRLQNKLDNLEAERRGAAQALKELEEKNTKTLAEQAKKAADARERIMFYVKVGLATGTPAATALGWLLTRLLHW